jgi:hypothetical protein
VFLEIIVHALVGPLQHSLGHFFFSQFENHGVSCLVEVGA